MELPQTWRPLGVMMAGISGGVLVFAISAACWVLFTPEVRATFDLLQRAIALSLGAMIVVGVHALVRAKAVATDRGLGVTNGYKQYDYEWAEVVAIHLPRGAPWATLDLADGTTRSVMGVQASDGARATKAVREIRALIAAHTDG